MDYMPSVFIKFVATGSHRLANKVAQNVVFIAIGYSPKQNIKVPKQRRKKKRITLSED